MLKSAKKTLYQSSKLLVSNQYCVGYEQVLRNTPLQVISKTVLLFHKHKRKKIEKDSQYLFNKKLF